MRWPLLPVKDNGQIPRLAGLARNDTRAHRQARPERHPERGAGALPAPDFEPWTSDAGLRRPGVATAKRGDALAKPGSRP